MSRASILLNVAEAKKIPVKYYKRSDDAFPLMVYIHDNKKESNLIGMIERFGYKPRDTYYEVTHYGPFKGKKNTRFDKAPEAKKYLKTLVEKDIKESLGEGQKEFPAAILKKIQGLTARNDHNAARQLAAKTMGLKKLEKAFIGIGMIMDFTNDMPHDLRPVEMRLSQGLWQYARENYINGEAVYQAM